VNLTNITLSPGNSKLGRIPNTSVVPVLDCKIDAPCKDKCYALKAFHQYANVRNAWLRNSLIWRKYPIRAVESIINQLSRKQKPVKYFRIHVAGDFIYQKHLDGWKTIARFFPETKFRAFTKRFDLDYSDKPDNLFIGFSMWPGCEDTAPEGMRVWVQDGTETRIPKSSFKCKNDCSKCKRCWDNPPKNLCLKMH
jgi:hypothetical protein